MFQGLALAGFRCSRDWVLQGLPVAGIGCDRGSKHDAEEVAHSVNCRYIYMYIYVCIYIYSERERESWSYP